MFSNEYTDTSHGVEQMDFATSTPQTGSVATSSPSAEQKSIALKEAQNGEVDQVAVAPVTHELTPAQRKPLLIPATGKKSAGTLRPPKGRRAVVNIGATVALVAVILGVLAAVLPMGPGSANSLSKIFNPSVNTSKSQQNNTALIAAEAATATAVTQDGFELNGAGGKYTFAGVQNNFTLPDGSQTNNLPQQPVQPQQPQQPVNPGSTGTTGGISSSTGTIADSSFYNPFTAGQCTYWADYEYHHLTGYAVPWTGNAGDWAYNARSYSGWNVTTTPHLPSIIVLQPGTQYAGGVGHVGVVEKINADGSVETTNWNVVGWGQFSWAHHTPGPGVSFVWHS